MDFNNITNDFRSRNRAGFFLAHSAAVVNTVFGTCLKLLSMKYEAEQKAVYVPIGHLALQGQCWEDYLFLQAKRLQLQIQVVSRKSFFYCHFSDYDCVGNAFLLNI